MTDRAESRLTLERMHGAGNTLLVYDGVTGHGEGGAPGPADALSLCDPIAGVGADGLLVLTPGPSGSVEAVIWNADGSDGGVCGNGLRCAAALLRSRGIEIGSLQFHTLADRINEVRESERGIEVCLGAPVFDHAELGIDAARLQCTTGPSGDGRIYFAGVEGHIVGMGNPHLVLWHDASMDGPELLDRAVIEADRCGAFGAGVNIHAVEIVDRAAVRVHHHERGAGRTRACGTGVCAVLAAGVRAGLLEPSIEAHCPGGRLSARLDEGDARIWLGGPTAHVATVITPPVPSR